VVDLLQQGDVATIVKESTEEQMQKAGNVGGEILNWIAMLGTISAKKPLFVKVQMQNGHAYAAWQGN
jgi:acyl-CoA hydrolase